MAFQWKNKMTIEERLEAITETLELTARTAQDTERRLAEHQGQAARDQDALRDRLNRLEETMTRQGEHVAQFADSCRAWIDTAERRFAELQEIARANSKRLEILEAHRF
jgi:cob(I)alamin adenosyltransferase